MLWGRRVDKRSASTLQRLSGAVCPGPFVRSQNGGARRGAWINGLQGGGLESGVNRASPGRCLVERALARLAEERHSATIDFYCMRDHFQAESACIGSKIGLRMSNEFDEFMCADPARRSRSFCRLGKRGAQRMKTLHRQAGV